MTSLDDTDAEQGCTTAEVKNIKLRVARRNSAAESVEAGTEAEAMERGNVSDRRAMRDDAMTPLVCGDMATVKKTSDYTVQKGLQYDRTFNEPGRPGAEQNTKMAIISIEMSARQSWQRNGPNRWTVTFWYAIREVVSPGFHFQKGNVPFCLRLSA